MKRISLFILILIISSGYYFPVTFNAFHIANTKMILAAIGLLLFGWEHVRRRYFNIRRDLVPVILLGLIFSLFSYYSVVENGTNDFVFATYYVSMAVWLGGAYSVIFLLRRMYSVVSPEIIFIFLGVMCTWQCIIAVMIDNIPALRYFVYTTFDYNSVIEYFDKNPRLYGIGASFDTAGIRFSCVLLGIGYLIIHSKSVLHRFFYVLLLLIIGIIGNMISRTTTVGLAITLIYLIFSSDFISLIFRYITKEKIMMGIGLCISIVIVYSLCDYMYDNLPRAKMVFDYGFEGFINWTKSGTYSTHSSDLLLSHIFDIHPDSTKTWLIGDGYFTDPNDSRKFYMGTDMGYIRYIFYCGLFGLLIFLGYFISCTYVLCKRNYHMNLFFVCLFVIQLIVWVKIPTDIFCFYALLLLADTQRDETVSVDVSNIKMAI